jgi:hypothetical protein
MNSMPAASSVALTGIELGPRRARDTVGALNQINGRNAYDGSARKTTCRPPQQSARRGGCQLVEERSLRLRST